MNEAERQEALTLSLGQVTCKGDHSRCAPHCDDCGEAKPCLYCGAAI